MMAYLLRIKSQHNFFLQIFSSVSLKVQMKKKLLSKINSNEEKTKTEALRLCCCVVWGGIEPPTLGFSVLKNQSYMVSFISMLLIVSRN